MTFFVNHTKKIKRKKLPINCNACLTLLSVQATCPPQLRTAFTPFILRIALHTGHPARASRAQGNLDSDNLVPTSSKNLDSDNLPGEPGHTPGTRLHERRCTVWSCFNSFTHTHRTHTGHTAGAHVRAHGSHRRTSQPSKPTNHTNHYQSYTNHTTRTTA